MNAQFAILNLGGWEIVLILAIVLLLFGATRLPKLARGLGQSIAELKKAACESPDSELVADEKTEAQHVPGRSEINTDTKKAKPVANPPTSTS
jgi:sec-independent protein translocase protein TatA